MLRVITERQGNKYSLDLHGMLGGEWVSVLDRQWRSIVDHAPTAEVTVVLSNVDFIDAAGVQLLRQMADGGVDFTVSGCLNRYVVENLRPTGAQRGQDDDQARVLGSDCDDVHRPANGRVR